MDQSNYIEAPIGQCGPASTVSAVSRTIDTTTMLHVSPYSEERSAVRPLCNVLKNVEDNLSQVPTARSVKGRTNRQTKHMLLAYGANVIHQHTSDLHNKGNDMQVCPSLVSSK